MVRGVYIQRTPAERMTVAQALKRYLAEVSTTKRPSTLEGERKKARPLFDSLGAYSLVALTPDTVADYRDSRLQSGRSNNTVRLELALLSHVFTVAIREWGIGLTFNPVLIARRPSPGHGRTRRLSHDEERRLIAGCRECSNPMLLWIVQIALTTAMRAGEILSLRREQISLGNRTVHLTESKNGCERTVPLSLTALEPLSAALAHPIRPIDTTLVFYGEPGRDGRRRPYRFQNAWKKALKRAAIPDLRFHDLRHEATSRFVEAGLSDQEVSAITGHRSMQMLKRYVHLRAQGLAEKIDRLTNTPLV